MAEEQSDTKQWYSNKELYEKFLLMFKQLEKELQETQKELQQTQSDVKQYNNLFEKQTIQEAMVGVLKGDLAKQLEFCKEVQNLKAGKWHVFEMAKSLWPIVISTVLFILAMTKVIN